ncbi:MAG: DUF2490 domain-containing protein [Bacteroidota bacterium]
MQKKILYTVLSVVCFMFSGFAQLSPPGLGETNTAFWQAVGVKQQLNDNNALLVYAGLGRISGPDSNNPINNADIGVFNAEVYHKLSSHLKYSYALSYRRQNHFDYTLADYAHSPSVTQEFRGYGRLAYTLKDAHAKYSLTLRQELREFYDESFSAQSNELQLRTRFKAGVTVPLDNHGNGLTGTAEALFSISDEPNLGWDHFGYKESRFCLYYTYAPASAPVIFDIGYMNDLMGHGHELTDASYLAVDVVLVDLF